MPQVVVAELPQKSPKVSENSLVALVHWAAPSKSSWKASYKSYIFSFLVATAAAVISALLVRRKLAKLDLIEVLKTRD